MLCFALNACWQGRFAKVAAMEMKRYLSHHLLAIATLAHLSQILDLERKAPWRRRPQQQRQATTPTLPIIITKALPNEEHSSYPSW